MDAVHAWLPLSPSGSGTQLDAFIISALKLPHPHGDIVVFPQSVVLVGFLQFLLMQDLINLSYFVPWWQ